MEGAIPSGPIMKTLYDISTQRERVYAKLRALARKRACAAHPDTGGHPNLIHNWGNAAAKKVWYDAYARWARHSQAFDDLFNRAEHVQNHGPEFRPMWCKFCMEGN